MARLKIKKTRENDKKIWIKKLVKIIYLRVLIRIMAKIVYSKTGEVTKAQSLYCTGFLGMYLRTGLAFKANSIQFLCKKKRWKSFFPDAFFRSVVLGKIFLSGKNSCNMKRALAYRCALRKSIGKFLQSLYILLHKNK